MSNEKDTQLAHEVLMSGQSRYVDPTLEGKIAAALATVRQEERRAAVAALTALPAQGTMNYRRGYEEGVRDAIRTVEAAAANENKKHDEDTA